MKKKIVIKVGTHVMYENEKISTERFTELVDFLAEAMDCFEVILVTSGAVATGYSKINLDKSKLGNRQALAAIGQPYLIHEYNNLLEKHGKFGAQLLLTADDFDSRKRTQKTKDAISALLKHNILPIINENDTTATEELVFGDNDQLSAHVAHFLNADLLIILSDIDGYYNKDPRLHNDAKILKNVHSIEEEKLVLPLNAGSIFATGGIVTKLKAADFLIKHDRVMFLSSGFNLDDVKSFLFKKKHIGGTIFSQKNWIFE